MKTHILAGLIVTGILATTAVQAATAPSAEEIYSGMTAAEIQKEQQANPAAERHSMPTCAWHQEAEKVVDQLHAPYPGNEEHFGEKDYLAAANTNFTC